MQDFFFFCIINHLRQLHWRPDSTNKALKTFYSDLSCDTFLLRSVVATAVCCLCSDTAVNIETSCAAAPPSLAVGRGCEASFTQHKLSPYQLPARSWELTFRHYLSSLCLPSKWGLRGGGVDKYWLCGDTNLPWRWLFLPRLSQTARLCAGQIYGSEGGWGASSWEYGQKMGGRNRR